MLQRKTVTLAEDYTYICQHDEAVDVPSPPAEPQLTSLEARASYLETVKAYEKRLAAFEAKWTQYLDGTGQPPLIPGGKPTVFKLRHLDTCARGRLMKYLARAQEDQSCFWDAAIAAFALGVKGVEGYFGLDGKPLKLTFENDTEMHTLQVLTAAAVNEFEIPVVLEVGGRVISRLNPSPK